MPVSSYDLAPARPARFAPAIVALDASADGLAAFSSESQRPVPAPAAALSPAALRTPQPVEPDTAPAARRPELVRRVEAHLDAADAEPGYLAPVRRFARRVPGGMGAGAVALLGGLFAGMVLAAVVSPIERPALGVGKLVVTSDPAGEVVSIDGAQRGVTPLTLVLAVGAHHVSVGDASATPRLMRVTSGGEAMMHIDRPSSQAAPLAIMSDVMVVAPAPVREATARPAAPPARTTPRPATGWLTIDAPFPVRVLVDGAEIGTSSDRRLSMPAGGATVVLVNDALEFRETREVTVAANRAQALAVTAPAGVLNANARPWAEVWVDGRRAGDTPLGNFALPIGEHEVVFKHPQLGEVRRTVTVGARTPARVSVEFQP
ncbi:MAG: PEGA domain-containing protein [Vicinamibacterales bacterium]